MDTEEVADTYVRTAARMSRMSLPIFVSCVPALSNTGILGRSWRALWEPDSPRRALSELSAYQWDSLYHRMRHRPVGQIGPHRPYLPSMLVGGYKMAHPARFPGSATGQITPVLATKRD